MVRKAETFPPVSMGHILPRPVRLLQLGAVPSQRDDERRLAAR
jgi:hypothetical protein